MHTWTTRPARSAKRTSTSTPVVADVEPGRVDVGLDPGTQLTAHLGKLWVQRQPRLPVDVEAPVLAALEQDDHPRALGRVVEHLQLQALVDGVVDDLEVEHAVDHPHL